VGRSTGTEAARAVIPYAFKTYAPKKLIAGHHPENVNSKKVLNKLGFEYWQDEDLGLGVSDVDESIQDILALSGRVHQPGLQDAPLVTVEDLVRLIQASPRRSEMAA